MMKKLLLLVFILMCFFCTSEASYVLRNGHMVNVKYLATMSIKEHFDKGVKALDENKWREATLEFRTIIENFSEGPLVLDSYYYAGVGMYHTKHPDLASVYFSEYLRQTGVGKFYQDAWEYKFKIAEDFRNGARKHFLGYEQLPKLMTARDSASKIYDEIIGALPGHDIAIKSMLSKGELLESSKEYEEAIAIYHEIIHKYSGNQLASRSYVNIARLYYEQCQRQSNDFDLLDLAKVNFRRFKKDFPKDVDNISKVEDYLVKMENVYAQGFYDTAKFYKKTKKYKAAAIYFQKVIKQFPDTILAEDCKKQLEKLDKEMLELNLKAD